MKNLGGAHALFCFSRKNSGRTSFGVFPIPRTKREKYRMHFSIIQERNVLLISRINRMKDLTVCRREPFPMSDFGGSGRRQLS
jgi:hypothetical protein